MVGPTLLLSGLADDLTPLRAREAVGNALGPSHDNGKNGEHPIFVNPGNHVVGSLDFDIAVDLGSGDQDEENMGEGGLQITAKEMRGIM